MSEFDDLIADRLRQVIIDSGNPMAMAQAGLWCPICGVDGALGDHECGPGRPTKGLLG